MIDIETSFQTFDPKAYLTEYYLKLCGENTGLLKFFARAYEEMDSKEAMNSELNLLEFGGGPAIYQLISASKKTATITFTDYLKRNLDEVCLWKRDSKKAFNWDAYFYKVLELEKMSDITENDIEARKGLLRKKMTHFVLCDAFEDNPLGKEYKGTFDVVSSNFVADSITTEWATWEQLIKNTCSLLKPNGTLILTSLKEAEFYLVGDRQFPAVYLTEDHILDSLNRLGFQNYFLKSIAAETEEQKRYRGYNGLILIKASR